MAVGFVGGVFVGWSLKRAPLAASAAPAAARMPASPTDDVPMEHLEARVQCVSPRVRQFRVHQEEYQCSVEHKAGSRALNVCWRNVLRCENGATVTGSACVVVQPRTSATRTILTASMVGVAGCDNSVSSSIMDVVTTPM